METRKVGVEAQGGGLVSLGWEEGPLLPEAGRTAAAAAEGGSWAGQKTAVPPGFSFPW